MEAKIISSVMLDIHLMHLYDRMDFFKTAMHVQEKNAKTILYSHD